MTDELVSIVIPTFNDAPTHLREAVESALAQTYAKVEVLVVNDGSTDPRTLDLISDLPEGVIVVHQKNMGVGAARNAGVMAAQGEFILPLDGDDKLDPHFVTEAVGVMADPVVEIACGVWRVFGEHEGLLEPPQEFNLADLMASGRCAASSMVRRARWIDVGGQDEDRLVNEDYELWIRVLRDGGVGRRVPSAGFWYRTRPGSRSREIEHDNTATWAAMVRNNPDHLGVLLEASQIGCRAEISDLGERLAVREAQLQVWARRTGILRRARSVFTRSKR